MDILVPFLFQIFCFLHSDDLFKLEIRALMPK